MLRWRQNGRWWWMLVAGFGAAQAFTTVTAHTVLIAIFGVWWLGDWALRRRRDACRCPAPVGATVGRRGGLCGRCWWLAPAHALTIHTLLAARWRPAITSTAVGGFTSPFFTGFWGLVFSPYRGLFWHTPLFTARAPHRARTFVRRQRSVAHLIVALSAALTACTACGGCGGAALRGATLPRYR